MLGPYEIVFTSYGSLYWLPNIPCREKVVTHVAGPGKVIYVVEFHPVAFALAENPKEGSVALEYPHLQGREPLRFQGGIDYANPGAQTTSEERLWNHGLGDVVPSVVDAGLTIEFLRDFHVCSSPLLPALTARGDGYFHLPWTATSR